jgi:hypothetical protein
LPLAIILGVSVAALVISHIVEKTRFKSSYSLEMKKGLFWNPKIWKNIYHFGRLVAFGTLGVLIVMMPVTGLAAAVTIKFIGGYIIGLEVISVVAPVSGTMISRWAQEKTFNQPKNKFYKFINSLNIPETRPVSVIGKCLQMHLQPVAKTGTLAQTIVTIVSYIAFVAGFIWLGGSVVGQSVFSSWFYNQFLVIGIGSSLFKVFLGGLLLLSAIYLLRYATWIAQSGIMSAVSRWPFKTLGALYVGLAMAIGLPFNWIIALGIVGLMVAEPKIQEIFNKYLSDKLNKKFKEVMAKGSQKVQAIVYMGGDALGVINR